MKNILSLFVFSIILGLAPAAFGFGYSDQPAPPTQARFQQASTDVTRADLQALETRLTSKLQTELKKHDKRTDDKIKSAITDLSTGVGNAIDEIKNQLVGTNAHVKKVDGRLEQLVQEHNTLLGRVDALETWVSEKAATVAQVFWGFFLWLLAVFFIIGIFALFGKKSPREKGGPQNAKTT